MKVFTVTILALFLSGCSGLLIHQSLTKGDVLTPEQIEQYNKVGSKAFSCLTLAGPPPAGSLVVVTLPKESKFDIKFAHNCAIMVQ